MRFTLLREIAEQPVTFLWHESENLENCDVILVPGGFAYGDYLQNRGDRPFFASHAVGKEVCR